MENILVFGFISVALLFFIWVEIGMLWGFFRKYFHSTYSFFDVSFIIAYFVQQFILIMLLEIKPNNAVLWVGLFALIVVTTASLQKLTMDSRDRELGKLLVVEKQIKEENEEFSLSLLEENEELKNQVKNLTNYINKMDKNLKKE